MKRHPIIIAVLVVIAAIGVMLDQPRAAVAALPVTTAPAMTPEANAADEANDAVPAFLQAVDVTPFARLALQTDGRVKTVESFARETTRYITGRGGYYDLPAVTLYLDLMWRPDAYIDADVIYVKSKLVRAQIADVLRESIDEQLQLFRASAPDPVAFADTESEARYTLNEQLAAFIETGMISEAKLRDPKVDELLGQLELDLMRTAKYVQAIQSAIGLKNPSVLASRLLIVPTPATPDQPQPWLAPDAIAAPDHGHPTVDSDGAHLPVVTAWADLRTAWRAENAAAANDAIVRLAAAVPNVVPNAYPQQSRLDWESWYFQKKQMTWVWVLYALALVPLLLHIAFRWSGARWLGMGMFLLAFGLHTFAVGLRWYVAGRWPNSNMFEAVTTAAWFGGCGAILFEVFMHRHPMRSLFALASSAASMVALMCAYFLPTQLNPEIGNMMPVLHDVWLYVHTNVIIFSYCLIFMASVSAGLYLVYRGVGTLRGFDGTSEYARVGGAGSLLTRTPDGTSYLEKARTTIGQVLDGTTMVLLELSFVLLWAGIVMGAIWADHSWGRPWGWDPKEVFALNTFLIFAVLIHVRLKVRDKGLWTALLAVVGCVVMLFNWIVINFTISGLHSYA